MTPASSMALPIVKRLSFFSILLCSLLSLTVSFGAQAAKSATGPSEATATNLTFTTFNIAWYGLGGSMKNTPADEYRNPALKSFIAKQLAKTDIFSFQEVVDVAGIQKNLLPTGWKCESYEHENEKHQHVVLCHRAGLQFSREPSDDNDVIDDVARNDGHSRPALHLIVSDSTGRAITRVIGVHLKAFPTFALTRYSQAKKIGMYLQTVADTKLPVVILGDFNSYPANTNGKAADDNLNIQTVLNKYQPGMKEVAAPFINSYRTKKLGSHFDRIYRSSNVAVVTDAQVTSACNSTDLAEIVTYNEAISDHCPVSATLKFTR